MKFRLRMHFAVAVALLAALPGFTAAQSDQTTAPQIQAVAQDQPSAPPDAPLVSDASATADADASLSPDDAQNQSSSAQTATHAADDNAVDHHILSTFLHDEYHIWTGPFHASNYDSHSIKMYGIPFILITGAAMTTDRYTAHWLPNTPSQVVWSGRVSQIGAGYTLAGFAGGTYLLGRALHNDHAKETGFLALEALAHSAIIVEVLKEITQRTRPADVTHGTGWWGGGSSFPSGHTITSFAVASVFAYEYSDHIAVPIAAYSVATIVALSRMGAQEHWASDIFVGGAMGFMVGRYVYKQHHDPELPGSLPVRRSVTARLKPDFGIGDQGLGLYWKF
jgi:membrane-associated phospholipid phosphatase